VAFGAAWFFAALLPVSGIAMTLFPAHVADRYLYIPLIGWALALGAVADRLAGMSAGRWRNLAFAAAAACAVLLAPTTSARLGDWRDSLGFWRSAWQGAPQNAYVLNNLGTSLRNAGALDEAEQALNAAILIEDRTAGPHINLAAVALARKDIGTAERQVRLALDLEPGNPIALNLLGVVNANRGRFEEAQRCFSDAARIWPGYPGALANIRQLARNMSARDARPVLMD
jgi:Flp pilus assembly protein TadD